jgi:isocitrate/isopropylmalate dehydrogenase
MRLAVLPGDDIGPEITDATLTVLDAADRTFSLGLEYDVHGVGMQAHKHYGTTLPDAALRAVREADGIILGPAGMTAYPPAPDGGINIPGAIRKQLDLYANIRPARTRRGVSDARQGLDCLIVRENTEGFYADRNLFEGYGEFMPTSDVAMSVRLITSKSSRRIAERAFLAASSRRRHVTAVGKRHVLRVTDGLFMREVSSTAEQHPGIKLREIDVDAIAAELYSRPQTFDVILTTNMFGDILSNLANALAGSLGLAAALNVGDNHAAANAGHGSAPDIAGKGIANPSGLILSSALLLEWLGQRHSKNTYQQAARAIERAIDAVLSDGKSSTRDLGGTLSTSAFAACVSKAVLTEAFAT